MKFAQELFPKGTFKNQETDGAYIDEMLAANLDILAEKIAEDMHFTLIISGHDMVGTGKTTILTHIGTYLTWKINQLHKVNNTFTHENLVFRGEDLPDRSLKLPPLSVIGLDEGDELTTHGMKALAIKLKRYFRKCRQLNQILILILPSFFELPKFYALSRSQALIDVEFQEKFARGYFKFYGMKAKKFLYIKGKREWDYDAYHSDFHGRFFGSYCFFPNCKQETELYLAEKHKDLIDDTEKRRALNEQDIERKTKMRIFKQIYENLDITLVKLAEAFGIDEKTGRLWIKSLKNQGM